MVFVELSQQIKSLANDYRGHDQEWAEYITPDTTHYSEKEGHKKRSIYFLKQHRKHFGKDNLSQ